MQINSISTNIPIYKNSIRPNYNRYLQNDVFIKTEQVSFGRKKKTRADIIKDFAKDVKKYYFDEPFDRKKIEKLIQKDIKDATVKSFEEINCGYNLPKSFMGLYSEEFNYDEEKQVVSSSNKTLYLKDPNEGEYSKLAYYANCVHEYTHLLQSSDNEFSAVGQLNKLLRKSKASPEVKLRTVSLAPQFAIDVEKQIKEPIFNSLNSFELSSKYIQKKPSVSQVYADNGIDNIKKFALDIMNENAKNYAEKHGEIDTKMIKEYTLSHLQRECEAYQVDYDTHKKIEPNIFNSPLEWDKLVKIQLYRTLSDINLTKF